MCGIAGLVGVSPHPSPEEHARLLCQAMHHRGPDGSGHYFDPAGPALLAHTRLSIIDLTERSRQPMTFDGRYHLIFNGEIYNYRDLRADLEKEGIPFLTSSDTEVILRLLIHRGPGALLLLRGMFALALWDSTEKRLLLARDPFGMKPLYVAQSGQGLAFASEVRTLLRSGITSTRLSPAAVADYLLWGCGGENLIEGITTLPPGTCWQWKDGTLTSEQFSSIPISLRENNATPDDFREAWLDSVRRHFISDVPVGLFLSGGVDSSSILAAAAALGIHPQLALTLGFPGNHREENSDAARIASHFGTPHANFFLEDQAVHSLYQGHLHAQDLPSMDGFNIFCVSHACRQHDLKVMLTGIGGDELLGGYPSFTRIPKIISLLRYLPLSSLHHLAPLLGATRLARMVDWASGPLTWSHAYRCYRGIFPRQLIHTMLLSRGLHSDTLTTDTPAPTGSEWSLGQSQVAFMEFHQYLQRQLLRDGDACSMAHSVELRHPFLDEVLWRTGASLPASIRFDIEKQLLQKCLPSIPQDVFRRPKQGFSLPYDSWFRGPLREFEDLIPPDWSSLTRTWYQKNALISLFHWMDKHGLSL